MALSLGKLKQQILSTSAHTLNSACRCDCAWAKNNREEYYGAFMYFVSLAAEQSNFYPSVFSARFVCQHFAGMSLCLYILLLAAAELRCLLAAVKLFCAATKRPNTLERVLFRSFNEQIINHRDKR
jgi:hypothetical protein